MAFRRPWRHRHLFLERWIPEGPRRTPESLRSARILSVPALAAGTSPSISWEQGEEAGRRCRQPSPPLLPSASNNLTNFVPSLQARCLHPNGIAPGRDGVRGAGASPAAVGLGVRVGKGRWGSGRSLRQVGVAEKGPQHQEFKCKHHIITAVQTLMHVSASRHMTQRSNVFTVSACFSSHNQLIAGTI